VSPRIQALNLGSQVYEALREMIANHRFQPGARLNVEALTRELGVSRTPVWQAVGRLEHEGLVERVPHRGVFMAVLTAERALELYAVREVLEAMAARLAATRIEEAALMQMAAFLETQRRQVAEGDLVGYSQTDFELHGIVYDACGNAVLRELLESLKAKMRPMDIHLERILGALHDDHVQLQRALADRDAERAELTLRRHNQLIVRHIERELIAPRNELGAG
jgi:DNA-binding GntR family transcriptional regulator